jgi:hypothetical protein
MPDFRDRAKKWIEKGYSVIPVNSRKNPSIPRWGVYQTRTMTNDEIEQYFKDTFGIALLCGGKWGVVGLDFDLKYDLTETLFERYKEIVPKEILKKMFVQKTKNDGYHFIFKAPASRMFSNQKLASRYTTAYERDRTYREAFADPETRDKATKIAHNDKSRILIETRSGSKEAAGGYVLISPTEGYSRVYGSIKTINEEEYDTLMNAARQLNEVRDLHSRSKNYNFETKWVVDPFEHYNEEGDIIELLIDNGWTVIEESGKNVRFKRPGQVHSNSSALYDKDRRIFNCFSTSTEFEPTKGYNPVSVFTMLECDNDFSLTYKKLVDLGYGINK